jgi:hypothetical protein
MFWDVIKKKNVWNINPVSKKKQKFKVNKKEINEKSNKIKKLYVAVLPFFHNNGNNVRTC